MKLDGRPELVAMHKESYDGSVHEPGFREPNGFASSALDAGPSRERFAFELLGVAFANGMRRCRQGPRRDSRPSRVEGLQAKGLEQLLQLDEDSIRSTAEDRRQDHAAHMINRLPQPALGGLALHETPPLIALRGFDAPHFDRERLRTTALPAARVDLGQTGGFFLIREARYWTRPAGRGHYRGSPSP